MFSMRYLQEDEIVGEIFDGCWGITPTNLYSYLPCNQYKFNALEQDKFLLTKPTLFNDPYDSLLFINREQIINMLIVNFDST